MPRERPLSLRLYFQPHLYELARALGYQGLPVPAARERVRALVQKHGKEKMQEASRELVCIDPSTDPPTARLKEEVRKLCWQLLGPPLEGDAGRHAGSCG